MSQTINIEIVDDNIYTTTVSVSDVILITGAVATVNGQDGAVVLDADDIDDSATAHKFASDAQLSKLDGIEAGATADQSGAEIVSAIDTELGQADWKTGGGGGGAVDSVNSQTGVVVLDADDIDDSATTNKFATAAQLSKLDGVEDGATADQTGAEIEALLDAELGSTDWKTGGGPTTGQTFSGALDCTNVFGTYYNDYTTGGTVNMSLAASPVTGGSATVRVLGSLTGTIPSAWSFSGDTLSTSASEFNEIVILYVGSNDIRIINRVIDAPDIAPPTISSFTISDTNPDRIAFSSSEVITATTFAGFTLGSGKTVTGITINAGQTTGHYFTVSSAYTEADGNDTIAYSGSGSNIQDGAGNALASFTATTVTNNVVAPTLSNFVVEDAQPGRITFQSSEVITATTVTGFTLGGGKSITGVVINTGQLSGHYFTVDSVYIEADGNDTISYTSGSDLADAGGSGLVAFGPATVTNNVAAVDITPPTISNFAIPDANPDRITFDSSEVITASTVGGFTLGGGKTITGVTINTGATTGHYFTVNSAYTNGDGNDTIAYSGTGSDLQDSASNALASFTATTVTNNVSPSVTYDTDYQAWLDYLSANGFDAPSSAQNDIFNARVENLKTEGVWAELDFIYMMDATYTPTGFTENYTRVNVKTPGSFTLSQATPANQPTFVSGSGFEGSGTQYFTTGFTPSTDGVNMSVSSATVASASMIVGTFGIDTTFSSSAYLFGCRADGSTLNRILAGNSGDGTYLDWIGGGQPAQSNVNQNAMNGHWHYYRSGATNFTYKDGTQVSTYTNAGTDLPALELYVISFNDAGSKGGDVGNKGIKYLLGGSALDTKETVIRQIMTDTYP